MRIHDITQRLGVETAVWPGDREPSLDWSLHMDRGDAVNVAVVAMSVHTGTHIDGGYHFDERGRRAAEMPLDAFLGPAVVVDAVGRTALDDAGRHVLHAGLLDGVDVAAAPRVLFRTREQVDHTTFPARFAHIDPALARRLGEQGARLVGLDTPSVDPVDSKTLEAHHLLAQGGVAILENALLADVAPGRYFLVALPLRLVDADSSPVRAVLIEDPEL
jgi:arylformamidase